MNRWFQNGAATSTVSLDDRAVQYGDGLFETVAIRDGQPRLWSHHLDRIERGCACLRMVMPKRGQLRRWLDAALRASEEDSAACTAKLILSSGTSERGYWRKTPTDVSTIVGIFAAARVPKVRYDEGVETVLCETRLALFSATAGCKTLNRLEQVLARAEMTPDGAFEGLMLDADGRLVCGTMSNVFIVQSNSIVTPSLERCGVDGVMRRHLIDVLAGKGVAVEVRDISEEELFESDEVFLSNSQFGVLPVRRCRDRVWTERPVTREVMAQLSASGVSECMA